MGQNSVKAMDEVYGTSWRIPQSKDPAELVKKPDNKFYSDRKIIISKLEEMAKALAGRENRAVNNLDRQLAATDLEAQRAREKISLGRLQINLKAARKSAQT